MAGCVLALLASTATARAAPPCPQDLRELPAERRTEGRLIDLRVTTSTVGSTGVRVLVPEGYDPTDRKTTYPMLLLLHGAYDANSPQADELGYRSWTVAGDAAAITQASKLIVVMPESGPDGGYVDWYAGGPGGRPLWETFHVCQLVPWIDRNFRTKHTRAARAVAGLSMGGYGAMHYAARHPDVFVAAASWSGALDTNSPVIQPTIETGGSSRNAPPGAIFGLRALQEVRWRGHNPADLASNLRGLDLTIRTGNGLPGGPGDPPLDPVEAEVRAESLSMHKRLVAQQIVHEWDDYGPGAHRWPYWQDGLRQLVRDLGRLFGAPPLRPPSPFRYRSIDPRYEVYGWTVALDRPALEFSELRDASPAGFALRGSGRASVATPPLWKPGQRVRASVRSAAGSTRATLTAAADCRLRVAVALGRANRYQQYTVQARAAGTAVYTTRVAFGGTPGGCLK